MIYYLFIDILAVRSIERIEDEHMIRIVAMGPFRPALVLLHLAVSEPFVFHPPWPEEPCDGQCYQNSTDPEFTVLHSRWTFPEDSMSSDGLGGALTYAFSDNFCAEALPQFKEESSSGFTNTVKFVTVTRQLQYYLERASL